MSAPFQPGDVVECVKEFPLHGPCGAPALHGEWYPRVGGFYRCCGIDAEGFVELDEDPDKFNPDYGWHRSHFRKIDDEVTPAFREQLRSLGKPKPVLNPERHSRERVS